MKRVFVILILLLTAATASAQKFPHRGFALGADRDTLLYIIASPFDNWYLYVGGGLQTFIGNEVEASARHNKLNFNARVELGKWLIPDIAVSLRLSFFNVDGQSRYGRQPFIDYTGVPVNANGEYEYQPWNAYAFSLMGFVTLDWTNFLKGYERGKRIRLHWFTPVGLGASMLFGSQKNPNKEYSLGDFRHNFELSFAFAVGAEYTFTPKFALGATIELFGSESTWDWSPYDNAYSIFDLIPSFNVTAKFNLLKTVTKYNPYTETSQKELVYHEFRAFGSSNTVTRLNGRIEQLIAERDSLRENPKIDTVKVIETLPPANMIEELLDVNNALNLPATIVYYQLDKYDLDYNARKRLQDFAREASKLDDTTEFYIIGAADSLTGTIRHNQWLSEHRAAAAYNMLVKNYGMSANQLIQVPIGGIVEYEPQENNRMALVIERTPITEEIVERWLKRSRQALKK